MAIPDTFLEIVIKYLGFLMEDGFKIVISPPGFSDKNVIGLSDGNLDVIVVIDDREDVVDLYLRKAGNYNPENIYSLFTYLVEKIYYRGGFPNVELNDPIEKQIAKQSLLLKENYYAVLKSFNIE